MHTVRGSNKAAGTALDAAPFPGAVIGIFFDREAGGNYENAFIKSLLNAVDTRKTKKDEVNVREFLSGVDMSEYWSYDGSLTTPPCTEGLKWSVIRQVQPISDDQLLKFTAGLSGNPDRNGKGNNRIVMPLNDRQLYLAADVPVPKSMTGSSQSSGAFALGSAAMAAVAALAF